MPDHFHKYFKTLLESGFVSRNKWLILLILGAGTGISGEKVITYLMSTPEPTVEVHEVKLPEPPKPAKPEPVKPVIIRQEIDIPEILEKCKAQCQGIVDEHEFGYHGRRR